ncbi:unnamed protein product [Echinostoma caproni]|uniref:G_PROTEIN_RECEP_F1_2 domain-containing protein n=1 Tax=Echinostoma caproni TaxID=27848 RepID=A0A183B1V5_9TREM|nr:unnamed protein product [Echinostoma caproni]
MSERGPISDSLSLTYDTWLFVIVIITLFLLIVITIVGNGLVFAALIRFTRLRSMSNVLIGNLALSDFLLALTILPLSAVNDATGHWLFGACLCDIWLAVDVFYCTASIWSLVAIAFDRFTATTFPIWYRSNQNQKRVLVYIVIVWILSGLICLPGLLGWGSKEIDEKLFTPSNGTHYPNRTVKPSTKTHVYDPQTGRYDCVLFTEPHYVVYSAMGSFIIPLIIMIGLYLKIFIVLRARGRLLRQNHRARVRSVQDTTVKSDAESSCLCASQFPNEVTHGLSEPVNGGARFECYDSMVNRIELGQSGPTSAAVAAAAATPPPPTKTTAKTTETIHSSFVPRISTSTQMESSVVRIDASPLSRDSSEQISEHSTYDPWIHSSNANSGRNRINSCPPDPGERVPRLAICPPSPLVGLDVDSTSHEDADNEDADNEEENGLPSEMNFMLPGHTGGVYHSHNISGSEQVFSNGRTAKESTTRVETASHMRTRLSLSIVRLTSPRKPHYSEPINGHHATGPHKINRTLTKDHGQDKLINSTGYVESSVLSEIRGQSDTQVMLSQCPSGGGGSTNNRERELARADYRERRATKRMGLIIFIFILCWIPFTLMYLVRGLCGEENCPDMPHLRMFVTWLGYANSALNPILYAVFNEQFRRAFITLLRCDSGPKSSIRSNSH